MNENTIFKQDETEEQIPFAQIPNALLRDPNLSFGCVGLLSYLLANREGWKISLKQIRIAKPKIGRDALYTLIKEGMENGYIKRDEKRVPMLLKDGKQKGCRLEYNYIVSRTPKFKNSLQFTPFQETDRQDTEKADTKEEQDLRVDISKSNKNTIGATGCAVAQNRSLSISFSRDKRGFEGIEPKDIEIWEKAYPALNVPEQLFKIVAWIMAKPSRMRTRKSWRDFIVSWLNNRNEEFVNPKGFNASRFASQAKKERKFGPCSNDATAIAIGIEITEGSRCI